MRVRALTLILFSLLSQFALAVPPRCENLSPVRALKGNACESFCKTNLCEEFYAQKGFTCKSYCIEQSLALTTAQIFAKCVKGATWNVAKGIVMMPIHLYNKIVEQQEFIDFCSSVPACKRQLADEAAFFVSDAELKKYEVMDLIRKREHVREMAIRDKNYAQWLFAEAQMQSESQNRDVRIPIPELESDKAALDVLWVLAEQRLKEMGHRLDCYDGGDRAELICQAWGSFVVPGATVTAVSKGFKVLAAQRALKIAIKETETVAPTVSNRAVDEMPFTGQRRNASRQRFEEYDLKKEVTTPEQNRAWNAVKENPEGAHFVTAEFADLRGANTMLKIRNLVTAIRNHFFNILNRKMGDLLARNPGLEMVKQSDWKGIRFAFKGKKPKDLEAQIEQAFIEANADFTREVRGWNILRSGDDPSKFFRAGQGENASMADHMARQARTNNPLNKMFSDKDSLAIKQSEMDFKVASDLQTNLQKKYGKTLLMETLPSGKAIPSQDLLEMVKVYKESDALAEAIRNRWGYDKFSKSDAQEVLDSLKANDNFSAATHGIERQNVNLDGAENGGLSKDMRNLNTLNQQAAATAIADSRSAKEAIAKSQVEEAKATQKIESMQKAYEDMRNNPAPGVPTLKNKMAKSGDELTEKFARSGWTRDQKLRFLKQVANTREAGNSRFAFVQKNVKSNFDRNQLSQHGEKIESHLRTRLMREMSPDRLKDLTFGIDMLGQRANTGQVGVYPVVRGAHPLTAKEMAIIRKNFDQAVRDQNKLLLETENIKATYTTVQDPVEFILVPLPTSEDKNPQEQ